MLEGTPRWTVVRRADDGVVSWAIACAGRALAMQASAEEAQATVRRLNANDRSAARKALYRIELGRTRA